jgi:pimeloyl-ACP methyl ester carboxylesterase
VLASGPFLASVVSATSAPAPDAQPSPPVIVLHGLTASDLRDEYTVDAEKVFSVAPLQPQDWERVTPHPDAALLEAHEPARVRPSNVVEIGYKELIAALRVNLPQRIDRPVPVFPFAYDWRRSADDGARRLGDFIREVIDRTRLLKHYPRDLAAVDLVGHSMGGMVIARCLAKGYHLQAGRPLVRRVATLGTAYHGAVDALEKLVSGESQLFGEARDSERIAARLIPSVYQHVPRFPGALLGEDGQPLDVYEPTNWQSSVFGTVAEHLRVYSRREDLEEPGAAAKRAQAAFALVSDWLAAGREMLASINSLQPKQALLDNLGPGHPGWLLVVGADERTRHEAQFVVRNGQRVIECRREQDEWSPKGDADPATNDAHRKLRLKLGDGTVPLRGAVPDWASREAVVCVGERDFGDFENFLLRKLPSLHSVLPWMNLVHRWLVAFLKDKQAGKARIWGRPLPDVRWSDWRSPVAGAEIRR